MDVIPERRCGGLRGEAFGREGGRNPVFEIDVCRAQRRKVFRLDANGALNMQMHRLMFAQSQHVASVR